MSDELQGVAIVGMAGRFPGARNVDQFWSNLVAGVESVTTFTDDALIAAGVSPELLSDPRYVKRWGAFEDADCFDAEFFGITRRDAELMDPQQRLLLQCAWETLESAGHAASRRDQRVGVYAGAGFNQYLVRHVAPDLETITPAAYYRVFFGNDKDFLCTRIAHALNLTGPAITIQTACSTSLVAVCQAALQLLTHQCDLALAGGVSLRVPAAGYLYEQGGTASPDGVCRAFDADAAGAVWGSGVAMVALKRVEDAIRDNDHVFAVIKGFAVNNDGSDKAGFSAPSVDGQAQVIGTALAMAGFDGRTMGYVEAHGTATALGDPIEIAALTQAFRENIAQQDSAELPDRNYCAIGSVKTNVGHLDTASGVTGLIKAALCLQHRTLPASLHYRRPNPHIDFATSPFYVNASLSAWNEKPFPRRAGVSSFGIGGTNAHVVLEETAGKGSTPTRMQVVLPLSAKSPAALDRATNQLAAWLDAHPDADLADVAFTLQVGRESFQHRRATVCSDVREAIAGLRSPARAPVGESRPASIARAWLEHRSVEWKTLHDGQRRSRIPLPTYSFERESFLVEREKPRSPAAPAPVGVFARRWAKHQAATGRIEQPLLVVGSKAATIAAMLERAGVAVATGETVATSSGTIVRLWSAHDGEDVVATGLTELQQQLTTEGPRRIIWLTERAQQVAAGDTPTPQPAALWGLALSFIQEQPRAGLSLLDVDDLATVGAPHIAAALDATVPLALRGGELFTPRLEPMPSMRPALLPQRDGAVLITGGLGGLGLLTAGHLARHHGVRQLVLLSRHPPNAAQEAALSDLRKTGAQITVAQADVADRESLAHIVRAHPLRGVVHAAGVLDDGIIDRLTAVRLEHVMRPKVLGARWLDELTRDHSLDFFVLFSSIASLGARGQANYAAANAAMEAVSHHRRAHGLPSVSIGWGPWAEAGMAARMAATGRGSPLRSILPAEGLALFDEALSSKEAVVFAGGADLLQLRLENARPPDASLTPVNEGADLRQFLRGEIARLLSVRSPEAVPLDKPFKALGVDSLMEVELRSSLSKKLGRAIPGGLLVDNPTVKALSSALKDLAPTSPARATPSGRSAAIRRLHPESPNPPLFLIGGAVGGDDLYLRDLASALGPLQPCYALLYPGMTGADSPLESVNALAEYFLAELRRFDKSGPVALGGHSLGGLIAFEMARRLERIGEAPIELLLLDAPLFAGADTEALAGSPFRETTLRGYVSRLRSMNWIAPDMERAMAGGGEESWGVLERSWQANVRAMHAYRPSGEYHGEATFLTPARDSEGLASCLPAWRAACPALKIARVAGNHLTMVRAPNVERTAHVIRGLLGHVERAS